MVLRGFDRDMVKLVQAEMESKGVRFFIGKKPVEVSKKPNGKLLVTWTGDEVSNYYELMNYNICYINFVLGWARRI
jgi:pyruvate/2-oxoglutarate dehydrogenase complex dihydrolipoamide dehydrogenase (E3) component